MPLPPDCVGEGRRRIIRSSREILLPRYLMNSNLDETYYLITQYEWYSNLVVRFWRSKVKVTAGRWGGEGIHVEVRLVVLFIFNTKHFL